MKLSFPSRQVPKGGNWLGPLLVAAAEAGDIVTGKALKLAKLLAAELDAMVAKK